MDFVNWYKIGCTTLPAGDCPTFFPLPKFTPGTEKYVAAHNGPIPTHVHKSGVGSGAAGLSSTEAKFGKGGDAVQVGVWVDGELGPEGTGTVGSWEVTPGSRSVPCDNGKTHASKDFWDPITQRRILWIWATVPSGVMAIPREITYHPGIQQVVYTPVAEMAQMRDGFVDKLAPVQILQSGHAALRAARAGDVEVYFGVPAEKTTLSATIGADGSSVFIDFVPLTSRSRSSATLAIVDRYMVDVGLRDATGKTLYSDTLPLLSDDDHLSLRIFLDGTIAEAYWQAGRVAMTLPTTAAEVVILSSSDASVRLLNASSYSMGSAYTSADRVLATPRRVESEGSEDILLV
jgi:hypothetical protein